MCGILGILSHPNRDLLEVDVVKAMRDTMTDRGPDGCGFFRDRNITLAHRRLAIRDVANGQQPWISQNRRFVIVYNGEIYNDHEIAGRLMDHGVTLRSKCDTEVLVEAWSLWGKDCIGMLRGMFAFGVVDLLTGKTWLVRDRFGVKPLFYAQVGNDFVFASSIGAIRKHPQFSSAPNATAISHYMQTLRITMGKETFFQNVYTLLPAEIVEIENGRLNHQQYWNLADHCFNERQDFERQDFQSAAEEVHELLGEAVKLRLKSDVAVGMMMSGGVDSNILATTVKGQATSAMIGVCGGGTAAKSPAATDGDFEYAQECAMTLGLDYAEVRVSAEQYLESWQYLVKHLDSPLATPSDPIIYQIAKRLRNFCGVALGGEGADEAFCGYEVQHWSGNDFERAKNLASLDEHQAQQVRNSLVKQYGSDSFGSISDHYLYANTLIPQSAHNALFADRFLAAETHAKVAGHYQSAFDAHAGLPYAQRYANVLLSVNLESLLRRLDTSTMAAGLEARVPYTDHLLVEKALSLPHSFKIDVCPSESQPWLSSLELSQRGSLRSKRMLRKIAHGILPERLANRPKKSFPTPLASWLSGDLKDWVTNKLQNSSFAEHVFKPAALNELASGPPELSLWNWPVVNTILWGESCFD
jgi:asparagine synthase (glutamine-hydrolysing)